MNKIKKTYKNKYIGPLPPKNKSAQSILAKILKKDEEDPHDIMKVVDPRPEEITIAKSYLGADDWQEFKRKFVEEYGGEPVEVTGMTHNELLHYINTSGKRENDEFDKSKRLRAILRAMEDDQ